MKNIHDFIVIGAGISGCTLASLLNKRFSDASVLLVEHGRRLGGRATTRKSRKTQISEFDHGLPSISFSQNVSQDILTIISPLIDSKKLLDISKKILLMNKFGVLNNAYTNEKIYRCLPFMMNFCEEIINQSYNPKKINFLFKTLIRSFERINNLWEIQLENGSFIQAENLILSSSLVAHSRCLKILKTNSLPLRDAFIPGKDKVIDSLLQKTSKLTFIKRKIYIFYVPNFKLFKKFNHQYLQILFSNVIREDLNYERIIFVRQKDGSIIIALHCSYIFNFMDINIDNIIKSLVSLFKNYRILLDLILRAKLLDIMDWRASQPLNNLLPKELQWSSRHKIGFCGDWFDMASCAGVESAMNSAIRLSRLLNK